MIEENNFPTLLQFIIFMSVATTLLISMLFYMVHKMDSLKKQKQDKYLH